MDSNEMGTENIKKKKGFIQLFSSDIFNFIFKIFTLAFIISAIVAFILFTDRTSNELDNFRSNMQFHVKLYHNEGAVDLSVPTLQPIDSNFAAGKFNVIQHLDGVKVTGIIVNTKSISFSDAEFYIDIGDQMQSFQIKSIPSGYSSHFEVFIPNVPMEKSRYANIRFTGGQTRYY